MTSYSKPIRGRSSEDRLTFQVFTTLKNAERRKVLGSFFKTLGISTTEEGVENCRFHFWKRYGERTPDCVLEPGKKLLFVEAKLDAPVDLEQLRDEYSEGISHSDEFYLLLVTDDLSEPDEVEALQSTSGIDPERIRWLGWASLHSLFQKARRGEIDRVSDRLLEDATRIMGDMGLRGFRRISSQDLTDWVLRVEKDRTLFREIHLFVKELNKRLKQHGIRFQKSRSRGRQLYRDGTGNKLLSTDWLTTYLSFAFAPNRWYRDEFWIERDHHLFVRFGYGSAKVWLGYRLNGKQETHTAAINRLEKALTESPELAVYVGWEPYSPTEGIPEGEEWVELAVLVDPGESPGRKLVETAEDWLLRLNELAVKFDLLPEP